VAGENIIRSEVAAVKGEEKIPEPRIVFYERIEDGVEKKLTEVVDGVGDKGSDTEVVGTASALGWGEVFKIDTGEV
jgi:hypothetical protein